MIVSGCHGRVNQGSSKENISGGGQWREFAIDGFQINLMEGRILELWCLCYLQDPGPNAELFQ